MSLEFKIVRNYSHALLVSARAISKENIILEQVKIIVQLMQDSAIIRNVLCSPIIDKEIKIKLVDLVADKYKFETISKQFLYLLIKNTRYDLLLQISDMLTELIAASKGVKSAEILSAFKLNKKEIQAIQQFIEAKLGQAVEVETNVEPSLIGGIVIKYDSNLIDCSVQGALDRIEKMAIRSKI